jgi:hypothetical protein
MSPDSEICSLTAIGGLRKAAPGGRLGALHRRGTRIASAGKPCAAQTGMSSRVQ